MPAADPPPSDATTPPLTRLPFPPITRQHILNCSYASWHARYRALTPKARLLPLTPSFLAYLRADGIVLPPHDDPTSTQTSWTDSDSGIFSQEDESSLSDDDDDEDALSDPSEHFRELHQQIQTTIRELGGRVAPRLNWSAPKDATWINPTNSMECRCASDVYLLLKSSDFVTHDLEHVFDDCVEEDATPIIPYTLILRKYILINPSVEFRCFVRNRHLLAITQRDPNHFDFLFPMRDQLLGRIQSFFDRHLRSSFPDENFAFDVYIPAPHRRVWLVDISPWAGRTDPLLFSWVELLTMPLPFPLPLSSTSDPSADHEDGGVQFRLIRRDDPEAYSFNAPQYSAHKLPRDVVDAAKGGVGPMRMLADSWLGKDIGEDKGGEEEDGDEEKGSGVRDGEDEEGKDGVR
ncbi:MAG: hypothetical protein M1817_006628 [Caeruleum heppii]|nr:MAG: hypothetical protein M1817_006628 [Caeruleum heppii]